MNGSQVHPAAQINIGKLQLFVAGVVIVIAALMLTLATARGGPTRMVFFLAGAAVVAWFFFGRFAWWIPVPLAVAFGGLFWVGFRIYVHEAALLLSVFALTPTLAMNWKQMEQDRPALPAYVYLLAIYTVLHLFASLVLVRMFEGSGYGNILRSYTIALWPMVFMILFYNFGSSRQIRLVITLMIALYLFRIIFGMYVYYFPQFIFVPHLNLLFSEFGVVELRTVSVRLFIIALGLFVLWRSIMAKGFLLLFMAIILWVGTFGGARIAVGQFILILALYTVLRRKYALAIVVGTVLITTIVYLNMNPEVLYRLPFLPSRALSVLVFSEETRIHAHLEGSDEWHRELFHSGLTKWLDNPITFFLGNRIYPFDEGWTAMAISFHERLDIASRVGRYEKGLWSILATLGLMGGVLYALTFFFLLKDPAISLWRNRISDMPHLIYFVAVIHIVMWVAFCWIWGHFPSYELMFAGLAKAVYEDQKRKKANADAAAAKNGMIPGIPDTVPASGG